MSEREVPRLVAIETTNACNAKCNFCPNRLKSGNRQTMSDELFRKIIDECTTFPLLAIEPFLNGEPFMDPQILPRLRTIRERLPKTKLRLYTNGYAMTPARIDEMQDLDIDHLYISLNTLDAAKYEGLMGLRLERTLKNIDYLVEGSRRDRIAQDITVRMTRAKDTTPDEEERFKAFCEERQVHCMVVGLFNYLGEISSDLPVPSFPCEHVTRLDVLSSGVITLCCMDTDGEFSLGDLRDSSLLDVYNGPRAIEYRDMHRTGRRKQIQPCGTCNLFWYSPHGLPLARQIQFGFEYGSYLARYRPFIKIKGKWVRGQSTP